MILIISRFSISNTDTIIPHIAPYFWLSFKPFIVAIITINWAIPIIIDNVFNVLKKNIIIANTSIPTANHFAFFTAFS